MVQSESRIHGDQHRQPFDEVERHPARMLESEEPDAGTRRMPADSPTVRLSGIVLAAVPRFMESHIVSRLQFNPPVIVFPFERTGH